MKENLLLYNVKEN